MKDTFGISRVLEPAGSIPVIAWKLDNTREIQYNEARIALERLHIEKGNFQQVCNQCGYEESKIKQCFMDMVDKRGKLHNPFTDSAGIFYGRIEEMGSEFAGCHPELKIGDKYLCNVTMTALPVYLDEITKIDYNYNQMSVKGYGIIFDNCSTYEYGDEPDIRYAMMANDEAGSLQRTSLLAKDNMNIAIIGKDIMLAMLYCIVAKKTAPSCHITVILDYENRSRLVETDITPHFKNLAEKIIFMDIRNPYDSFNENIKEPETMDLVINCEDKPGAETISTFLCRDKGQVYFTRMRNRYSTAILVAESMRKNIYTINMDQYFESYNKFTCDLLIYAKPKLDEIDRLYEKSSALRQSASESSNYPPHNKKLLADDFVYASHITNDMIDNVLNIAKYDCNVIIQGETGVGKEKVLQLIHKNSERNRQPCITVNCATIQENLAESEFFGYEAGAFTGAQAAGKKGYFELANNGILFLDEIGTLSTNMQSKLLRILQENQFYKVGGTEPINVNVRVICANNIFLQKLVNEGRFREDLYYRLNICQINVPPLRDRKEDIDALAKFFLAHYNKKYGMIKEISADGYLTLNGYNWPGNVRELDNIIHRLIINCQENIITGINVDAVLNQNIYDNNILDAKSALKREGHVSFDSIIEAQEKQLIAYALEKEGTTRKAAEALDIGQAKLMRKKQKYNL